MLAVTRHESQNFFMSSGPSSSQSILSALGCSSSLIREAGVCWALSCLRSIITIAIDAIRLYLADLDSWFPFTEGVFYGTIGTAILYGVLIWISVIVINIKKIEDAK